MTEKPQPAEAQPQQDHNMLVEILKAIRDQGKQLEDIKDRLDRLDNTVEGVTERMKNLEKSQKSLEANMTVLQQSYHQFGTQIGLIQQHCAQRGDAIEGLLKVIECNPGRRKPPTGEMSPNGGKDGT